MTVADAGKPDTMPPSCPVPLPVPRGPLSSWVIRRLERPHVRSSDAPIPTVASGSGWSDDLQLALYLGHHLHLGAWRDRPGAAEWDADLIALRCRLEDEFLAALRHDADELLAGSDRDGVDATELSGVEVVRRMRALIEADTSPSVSSYVRDTGSLAQFRDVVTARAAYQLTEGDFHTFAIPRLPGRAKQLLAAIQAGEYGADAPGRELHAALFAQTMRELDLDDRPYALLDRQGVGSLAVSNLISTLALHASRRGALVGHLAVFEMTSVEPMGRYAAGLRRLGASEAACRFYDVHVLADAEHEHMAAEMVAALVDDEPGLAVDVLFGAAAALAVERRYADELFGGWVEPATSTPSVGLLAV